MNSKAWDEPQKKNIRELTGLVLGLVAGTVVLLPSLASLIYPPYILGWLLFAFLVSSIISFVLLGITLYLTFTKIPERPDKFHSYGNLFAILSFILITYGALFVLTMLKFIILY